MPSCARCLKPLTKKPGPGRWPKWCSVECRRASKLIPPDRQRKRGRPRTGATWITPAGYVWVSPLDDAERNYPTSGRDGRIARSHLIWNRAHPDDVVQPGEEL